jgi:adenylate cyclase
MALEIERKYLVRDHGYRPAASHSYRIQQGFLNDDPRRVVRVRIMGNTATLTVKSPVSDVARREFEYTIPIDDARLLIGLVCLPPTLEKTRHIVEHGGLTWEVDEFEGENEGLVIAEVELPDTGTVPDLPSWIGEEVTGDSRYYNANLVRNPYRLWKGAE